MDPGRLLGCTDSSLSPRSAPADGLSLESDAFRCPRRLERHKRPKGMHGTHSKNDSDQTGSQPRSSVIGRRSSSVRPSVRCSSAGRSRPVSSYLSSIWLASYAPYAPTLPTAPGVYLPTAHPFAAALQSVSTSTSTSVPARRISGAQGYHDTGEEKTVGRPGSGARRREGEKARAKGRQMEKEDTGRGRTPS